MLPTLILVTVILVRNNSRMQIRSPSGATVAAGVPLGTRVERCSALYAHCSPLCCRVEKRSFFPHIYVAKLGTILARRFRFGHQTSAACATGIPGRTVFRPPVRCTDSVQTMQNSLGVWLGQWALIVPQRVVAGTTACSCQVLVCLYVPGSSLSSCLWRNTRSFLVFLLFVTGRRSVPSSASERPCCEAEHEQARSVATSDDSGQGPAPFARAIPCSVHSVCRLCMFAMLTSHGARLHAALSQPCSDRAGLRYHGV